MILSGTWRSYRSILFTYVALPTCLPTSLNRLLRILLSCFAATSRGRPPAIRSSRPFPSGASFNHCKILSTVCTEGDVPSFFFTTPAIPALSAPFSLMPIIRPLAKGLSRASDAFLVFLITLKTGMSAESGLLGVLRWRCLKHGKAMETYHSHWRRDAILAFSRTSVVKT